MNLNLSKALDLTQRAATPDAPVLVAIDGRSGVGKSTFAADLAAVTQAQLIEGDDFYAGGLKVRSDTAQDRVDACIDRPKLRAVLEQLKAGRAATYRPFDWTAFDGSLSTIPVTVNPERIVIVEGVYSSHPDFADLLSVKILIQASDEVRLQRLLEREGSIGSWEMQWHEAEEWYFSRVSEPCQFDLVID